MKFQSTLLLAAAAGSALAVPHGPGHKKRASVFECKLPFALLSRS